MPVMTKVQSLDEFVALADNRLTVGGQYRDPALTSAATGARIIRANQDVPRTFVHNNDFVHITLRNALGQYAAALDERPEDVHKLFGFGGHIQCRRVTERFNTRPGREMSGEVDVSGHLRSVVMDPINSTLNDRTVAANRSLRMEREWSEKGLGRGLRPDWILSIAANVSAVAIIKTDRTFSGVAFKKVIELVQAGDMFIDDLGKAAAGKKAIEAGRPEPAYIVKAIERVITQLWCQMADRRVRIGILTTHTSTIVLYNNSTQIEVSDVITTTAFSVNDPLERLLPLFFAVSVLPDEMYWLPPVPSVAAIVTAATPGQRTPQCSLASYQAPGRTYVAGTGTESGFSFDPVDDPDFKGLEPSPIFGPEMGAEELGPNTLFLSCETHSLSESLCERPLFGPVDIARLRGTGVPTLYEAWNGTAKSAGNIGLSVTDFASRGALWNCFLVGSQLGRPPLVVKLANLSEYLPEDELDPSSSYLNREMTRQDAQLAIAKSSAILSNQLSHLAGTVVPHFFGLWGGVFSSEEVWVVVEEDAGQAFEVDEATADERDQILRGYLALHEAGVCHVDVEDRHWRRSSAKGPIRIIDFDQAITRDSVDWEYWDKVIEAEMSLVERLLQRQRPKAI